MCVRFKDENFDFTNQNNFYFVVLQYNIWKYGII